MRDALESAMNRRREFEVRMKAIGYINPDQVAKDIFGDWNSQKAVLAAFLMMND